MRERKRKRIVVAFFAVVSEGGLFCSSSILGVDMEIMTLWVFWAPKRFMNGQERKKGVTKTLWATDATPDPTLLGIRMLPLLRGDQLTSRSEKTLCLLLREINSVFGLFGRDLRC